MVPINHGYFYAMKILTKQEFIVQNGGGHVFTATDYQDYLMDCCKQLQKKNDQLIAKAESVKRGLDEATRRVDELIAKAQHLVY